MGDCGIMGWQLIQAYNVGDGITSSPAASVTFSSIPQTYKSLKVVISSRTTNTGSVSESMFITFNGASTNFSDRYLQGSGAAASSGSNSGGTTKIYIGESASATATSNTFNSTEVTIPNYSGSTNKPIGTDTVHETNATTAYQTLVAGLWSNTNAITSIGISLSANNFVFGSTFQLYGLI